MSEDCKHEAEVLVSIDRTMGGGIDSGYFQIWQCQACGRREREGWFKPMPCVQNLGTVRFTEPVEPQP
jgi:hypothetical protein